ncbi:MAG: ribosome silencing factor [Desulfobacterium sp.]|jgi:ribosome-associated protein|nr:ribosome silencing factor [Desulfobacterium sp.]
MTNPSTPVNDLALDQTKNLTKDPARDLIDTLAPYLVQAFARKTQEITVLDVRNLTSYTDAIMIITAQSQRQVSSIAEHIHIAMKKENNLPIGTEGMKQGTWALLDYGDVVINVFDKATRDFYDLEGLWSEAPRLDLSAFKSIR